MICSFYNKQEAVEVIPLCLDQNEVTGRIRLNSCILVHQKFTTNFAEGVDRRMTMRYNAHVR